MSNWVGSIPLPRKNPDEGPKKKQQKQPERRPDTSHVKKIEPPKPVKVAPKPPPPPPPKRNEAAKGEGSGSSSPKGSTPLRERKISVYAVKSPGEKKDAPQKPAEEPAPGKVEAAAEAPKEEPEVVKPVPRKKETPPPSPPPTPPPSRPPTPPPPPPSPPPTPKRKPRKKKEQPVLSPGSPKRRTLTITTETVHTKKDDGKTEIVTEEFYVEPLEKKNEDTRTLKHADTMNKSLNLFRITHVPRSEGGKDSNLARSGMAKAQGVEEQNKVAAAEQALEDGVETLDDDADPYNIPALPPRHAHKAGKHLNFGNAIDVSNLDAES